MQFFNFDRCSLFITNSKVTVTKWKLCFLPGWSKVWKRKGIRFKKVMILSWNTNSGYKKENWLSFSQFTVSLLSVRVLWLQGEETCPSSFNQKGTDFPAIMSPEIDSPRSAQWPQRIPATSFHNHTQLCLCKQKTLRPRKSTNVQGKSLKTPLAEKDKSWWAVSEKVCNLTLEFQREKEKKRKREREKKGKSDTVNLNKITKTFWAKYH